MAEDVPNTQSAPVSEEIVLHFLFIKITSGSELPAADMNGKSDPYCLVTANKQTYNTRVKKETLKPIWNESTTFCFLEPCKEILFEVWDEDGRSKDDVLGSHTFDVSGFYSDGHPGFTGDLDIFPPGKKSPRGSIRVSVRARVLRPTDLEQRIAVLETETTSLQSELDGQNSEIEQKSTEKAELEKSGEELGQMLEGVKSQHMILQDEMDERRNDIDGMNQLMNEMDQEMVAMKKETAETNDKRVTMQEELSKLKEEDVPEKTSQLDKVKREVASARETLEGLK